MLLFCSTGSLIAQYNNNDHMLERTHVPRRIIATSKIPIDHPKYHLSSSLTCIMRNLSVLSSSPPLNLFNISSHFCHLPTFHSLAAHIIISTPKTPTTQCEDTQVILTSDGWGDNCVSLLAFLRFSTLQNSQCMYVRISCSTYFFSRLYICELSS